MAQLWLTGRALAYSPYSSSDLLRDGCERVIDHDLVRHFEDIVDHQGIRLALFVGVSGPQQKPVIALLTRDGVRIGYAKVGWQPETRALVQAEACALRTLEAKPFEHAELPKIIHYGRFRDLLVLLMTPLTYVRARSVLTEKHVEFLLEVAQRAQKHYVFGSSPLMAIVANRCSDLQAHLPVEIARKLHVTLGLLHQGIGNERVPFTWSLGDFAPWNVGFSPPSGRLVVMDVEYASDQRSPGWDMFHFLTLGGNRRYGRASLRWLLSRRLVKRYFDALGVDWALEPYVLAAYLLDIWTRRAEDHLRAYGGLSGPILGVVVKGLSLAADAVEAWTRTRADVPVLSERR